MKLPAEERITFMRHASSRHAPSVSIEQEVARPEESYSSSISAALRRTSLHARPKTESPLRTAYDYYLEQARRDTSNADAQISSSIYQSSRHNQKSTSPQRSVDSGPTSLPSFKAPARQAPRESHESLEESFRKLNTLVLRNHLKNVLASLEEHQLISSVEKAKVERELDSGDRESQKSLMRSYSQFVDNQSTTHLVNCVKQIARTSI
jgi:hypothetical protein